MQQMINMSHMIQRRGVALTVTVERDGYFDMENGGVWHIPETDTHEVKAIVVPADADEVVFDEGGIHVNRYKKVYVLEPLPENGKVTFKAKPYTVMGKKDYSDYATGLMVYFLKRTDAHD